MSIGQRGADPSRPRRSPRWGVAPGDQIGGCRRATEAGLQDRAARMQPHGQPNGHPTWGHPQGWPWPPWDGAPVRALKTEAQGYPNPLISLQSRGERLRYAASSEGAATWMAGQARGDLERLPIPLGWPKGQPKEPDGHLRTAEGTASAASEFPTHSRHLPRRASGVAGLPRPWPAAGSL